MNDSLSGGPGVTDLAVEACGRRLTLDELAALNHMTLLGHVVPNVAHELNNALQIIGGLVEMLSARNDVAPPVAEKIGRIGAQADRAAALVRELIAFTRAHDAGRTRADVRRLIDRALLLRRYHLGRARLQVEVDADGPALVEADAHELELALLNLVVNAEQAMAGQEGGRLRIELRGGDGRVDVAVADNGPGMTDEERQRALRPFGTTRGAPGLGLTVTDALIRRAGGTLRLEPNSPRGTRVVLTLPAALPA